MRILIVEDDLNIGDLVFTTLREISFSLDWVSDMREAQAAMKEFDFHLLVIGAGTALPLQSHLDAICDLRSLNTAVPAIVLTDDDTQRRQLSDCADSVITLPFESSVLLSTAHLLIENPPVAVDPVVRIGGLYIDFKLRCVRCEENSVKLSPKEYAVLRALAANPGGVVSRIDLLDGAYHWDESIGSNSLEVHISNLRKKLGKQRIQTQRGIGYRLVG